MLILGQRHLEKVPAGYLAHYNQHRPHRALGQAPPLGAVPDPDPAASERVVRLDRLGGLIHEYAQAAGDERGFRHPQGKLALAMVGTAMDALTRRDVDLAQTLPGLDDPIDQLNRGMMPKVLEASGDKRMLEWGIRMYVVSRQIERIGDNAVDIGEQVALIHRCLTSGDRTPRATAVVRVAAHQAGSFGHHARLEDDNRRPSRASRSVTVEVLVQFAPAPPQPLTLLAHRSSPEHLAPDPTGQLDHRLWMGLQVEPPGWLGWTPAVHGHRDQVGPVLVVADDHAPRLAAAPAHSGEPQGAPLPRARRPQPLARPAHPDDPPVQVPEGHDEPPRW
jgi:PhoU domain